MCIEFRGRRAARVGDAVGEQHVEQQRAGQHLDDPQAQQLGRDVLAEQAGHQGVALEAGHRPRHRHRLRPSAPPARAVHAVAVSAVPTVQGSLSSALAAAAQCGPARLTYKDRINDTVKQSHTAHNGHDSGSIANMHIKSRSGVAEGPAEALRCAGVAVRLVGAPRDRHLWRSAPGKRVHKAIALRRVPEGFAGRDQLLSSPDGAGTTSRGNRRRGSDLWGSLLQSGVAAGRGRHGAASRRTAGLEDRAADMPVQQCGGRRRAGRTGWRRVAQRQSTAITWQGSGVRFPSAPTSVAVLCCPALPGLPLLSLLHLAKPCSLR